MSNFNKGKNLELEWSQKIHEVGIPLLISSLVLRNYSAGQVDLARIHKKSVQLFEVKSQGFPHGRQLSRLKKSADWMGQIFHRPVELHFLN